MSMTKEQMENRIKEIAEEQGRKDPVIIVISEDGYFLLGRFFKFCGDCALIGYDLRHEMEESSKRSQCHQYVLSGTKEILSASEDRLIEIIYETRMFFDGMQSSIEKWRRNVLRV